MSRRPLIAFSVHMYNHADGPGYCIGTEAYGLEMTLDDEWSVDTVIMCPPRYVAGMADVTSMGAQTGASYFPGNQDLHAIADAGATWVLTYPEDPVRMVTDSGLSVLLIIDSVDDVRKHLNDLPRDANKLAIAIQTNGQDSPAKVEEHAASARKLLSSHGLGDARILACGWFDLARFKKFSAKQNLDGVLILDADSADVIYIVAAAVGVELD